MEILNEGMMTHLKAKFGDQMQLVADAATLRDLLEEIYGPEWDRIRPPVDPEDLNVVAGYEKTYDRDYERQNYEKQYTQYDRTIDNN